MLEVILQLMVSIALLLAGIELLFAKLRANKLEARLAELEPQTGAIDAARNEGFTKGWMAAHDMARDPVEDDEEEDEEDLDDTDFENHRNRMIDGCA